MDVVTGIIFRTNRSGIEIMTQTRRVQNLLYDPLYDGTQETVSGCIKMDNGRPTETAVEALLREIPEECGVPEDFQPAAVYGVSDQTIWTTGKNDQYLCVEPFCFVQSLGPPQPWFGPVFLVEVDHNFKPDERMGDGEAGAHRWWSPEELLKEIRKNPGNFMGPHIGPLVKFCDAAIAGRI